MTGAAEVVMVKGWPTSQAVRSLDADWVVLREPGEAGESNDVNLKALLEGLRHLPEEASGVEVSRTETSATGTRSVRVVRAWRPASFVGFVGSFEPEPKLDGRTVVAKQLSLTLERLETTGLLAQAEGYERKKQWMDANRAWLLLGDESEAWCAYGLMRAALSLAMVAPTGREVRRLLGEAWTMAPRLQEAGLRLAGWWLARGAMEDALAVAEMADRFRAPLVPVPQLHGSGEWAIPAYMALWMCPHDHRVACHLAERALARSPPPELVSRLRGMLAEGPIMSLSNEIETTEQQE